MTATTEKSVTFPSAPEGSAPSSYFRAVLGNFPTGVAFISATGADGATVGMVVGSFTSVSLDPPLVAFLPDKSSTSFPKIREAGRFAVNVLASDQADTCRLLASKVPDKFLSVSWDTSTAGVPVLADSVAWVECEITQVVDAGDHYIVLGAVSDLKVESNKMPLVFFRGEYGAFRPRVPFLAEWQGGWG